MTAVMVFEPHIHMYVPSLFLLFSAKWPQLIPAHTYEVVVLAPLAYSTLQRPEVDV